MEGCVLNGLCQQVVVSAYVSLYMYKNIVQGVYIRVHMSHVSFSLVFNRGHDGALVGGPGCGLLHEVQQSVLLL